MNVMQVISVQIQFLHPDPKEVIKKLTNYGYVLRNVDIVDEITSVMSVDPKDYKQIVNLLDNWSIHYSIQEKSYISSTLNRFLRHWVLLLTVLLLIVITSILQTRVMFIEVAGNNLVPTSRILNVANTCGIHIGAKNVDVRSEKIKNVLLEQIPEFEWIGVNTNGCVATIYVREKPRVNSREVRDFAVSSMIASTEGIVTDCFVKKGTLLCGEGQTVQKGQVLISGYTDCGTVLKATTADGEVYANTLRNVNGVIPAVFSKKMVPKKVIYRFGIRVGKKLINFENNSGICGGSCDKILKEKALILPGGFVLPFSLIIEEITVYNEQIQVSLDKAKDLLYSCCVQYLDSVMVAGSIENEQFDIQKIDDCFVLSGSCICSEMIGRRKNEDIFTRGN